jgi:hypothetical protein
MSDNPIYMSQPNRDLKDQYPQEQEEEIKEPPFKEVVV